MKIKDGITEARWKMHIFLRWKNQYCQNSNISFRTVYRLGAMPIMEIIDGIFHKTK